VNLRTGGSATRWPWKQLEFRVFRRCITINISRMYPKEADRA
jgi:hypothetical protein